MTASIYLSFGQALKDAGFAGGVLTQSSQRLMYATDNSIYQQHPQLIVQPMHMQDVQLVQQLIGQEKWRDIHVTPYGGGTGTNGQALNYGLVVDCKHQMHHIEKIDLDAQWVQVEPGITLSQLNDALKPLGMFFAPEVSPANRATIGGMVATDASGKGSRVYGKTSAHLLNATMVLPGGKVIKCSEALENPTAKGLRELLAKLCSKHSKEINKRFPAIAREATGYNLKRAMDNPGRALQYIIAGSEGTLGILTSLTLKLTAIPPCKTMLVVGYPNFQNALGAVSKLIKLPLHAIETLDQTLLDLAREDSCWQAVEHIFADAVFDDFGVNNTAKDEKIRCCNLIEIIADNQQQLEQQLASVTAYLTKAKNWHVRVDGSQQINAVWNLRARAVGILGNMPGDRQPTAFIEDCAVAPEKLPKFIDDIKKILDSHSLSYALYGHVDVGCMHLRPALNLASESDRELWQELTRQVMVLCQKHGGVFWGEHGKGWRSGLMVNYFGEVIYAAMCQIKQFCDPHNQMNPGKLATPSGDAPTYFSAAELRSDYNRQIATATSEHFADAIRCNGNTVCLDYTAASVMCPSWKVTRDLRQSPKGRANLIREWLRRKENNQLDDDFTFEVNQAMDGCLGCKACASTCPVQVSIPELKSRFLELNGGASSLRDKLLAAGERIAIGGTRSPKLFNLLVGNLFSRRVSRAIGIYDTPYWQSKLKYKSYPIARPKLLEQDPSNNKIVLICDAFLSAYNQSVLLATARLLKMAGAKVYLSKPLNSGKSNYIAGNRNKALQQMSENAKLLNACGKNATLLALEPSITLFMQQEYKDNKLPVEVEFAHSWLADKLAEDDLNGLKLDEISGGATITLLAHCTEQSTSPKSIKAWHKLAQQLNITLYTQQTGCCGMAGWYGHLSNYAENSKKLFERSWQGPIKEAKGIVTATGYSCRSQTLRHTEQYIEHPLETIYRLLGGKL